jgi:hypothetical protein
MKALVIGTTMTDSAEHRLQNAMGQRPALGSDAANKTTHKKVPDLGLRWAS